MPQTLLALLGLLVVMTFNLSQWETTTQAHLQMVRNEVGMAATGVAAEVFAEIEGLPYDANGAFGAAADWASAADVDDLDGLSTSVEVETRHGAMAFEVAAEVRYVRKNGEVFEETASDEGFKEVVLTLSGLAGFEARLSRVYGALGTLPTVPAVPA